MDVLTYSAFQAQYRLADAKITKTAELATKTGETANAKASADNYTAAAVCWMRCREQCLQFHPHCQNQWVGIPDLGTVPDTNAFKVCHVDLNENWCGKDCSWTVPEGVGVIRFQLWGAGGGSGSPQCCGHSSHGATGAYASVIIPATAGCQYTICAGCAYKCFPTSAAEGREPGCQSYVQGYGLQNFCANGGGGRMGNWLGEWYGKHNQARHSAIGCDSGGGCYCSNGSWYCFDNSCSTGNCICYMPDANYYGHVTHPSSDGGIVYGIRGMWPRESCVSTNHYYCAWSAPIYPWGDATVFNDTYTSGCMCKGCDCRGQIPYPGAGGYHSHAMNNAMQVCGDAGKFGMVCVQWL